METKHTPGPWSQGRCLNTLTTQKWSEEQISKTEKIERTLVFSNFSAWDEGKK